MNFDIFAHWANNEISLGDIDDSYFKIKYLLTRVSSDARKRHQELMSQMKFADMGEFIPDESILVSMPLYSFFLQFTATLATPFLSKDDESFYIIDNPIKKDKVFKVPMMSGSGWKGNMRWTAKHCAGLNEPGIDMTKEPYGEQIIRLFGNEKGEGKHFHRGRLNFFPTFFDKIGLEVINPHDRRTKAGTTPVQIESVPKDASGTFSLLYVPFDLIGEEEAENRRKVAEDLPLVYDCIREMMLTYGFSAKKGAGFGIAKNTFSEKYVFKMKGIGSKGSSNRNTFDDLGKEIREYVEELMR